MHVFFRAGDPKVPQRPVQKFGNINEIVSMYFDGFLTGLNVCSLAPAHFQTCTIFLKVMNSWTKYILSMKLGQYLSHYFFMLTGKPDEKCQQTMLCYFSKI